MSKFSRFDPRNKKKNRNKYNSLEKLMPKIKDQRAEVRKLNYEILTPENTVGVSGPDGGDPSKG